MTSVKDITLNLQQASPSNPSISPSTLIITTLMCVAVSCSFVVSIPKIPLVLFTMGRKKNQVLRQFQEEEKQKQSQ